MKDGVHSTPDPGDAPQLIRDMLDQASRLVRNEVELAKRDVSNRVTRAGVGIAMMAVAAILALTALDVLAAAAVAALAEAGLSGGIAALIVGGAIIVLALILFFVGKGRINPKNLAPKRAARSVRRDIETIRGNGHG